MQSLLHVVEHSWGQLQMDSARNSGLRLQGKLAYISLAHHSMSNTIFQMLRLMRLSNSSSSKLDFRYYQTSFIFPSGAMTLLPHSVLTMEKLREHSPCSRSWTALISTENGRSPDMTGLWILYLNTSYLSFHLQCQSVEIALLHHECSSCAVQKERRMCSSWMYAVVLIKSREANLTKSLWSSSLLSSKPLVLVKKSVNPYVFYS